MPSSIGAKSCSSFTATQSFAPKPPTCPSRLQPVHQGKSCLDLLHLAHMTQCHVSFAMSSFIITCVSFATSPNHFHLHDICCSDTCTCGLITCVSHINTISPPRVVTQLTKPHKDLSDEKTGGRRCRRVELSRGDRSLARTWARLDGGKEMRNKERAVGYGRWLGVCTPWLDVVDAAVETHV